jgi:GT2 family glycosyltransferase
MRLKSWTKPFQQWVRACRSTQGAQATVLALDDEWYRSEHPEAAAEIQKDIERRRHSNQPAEDVLRASSLRHYLLKGARLGWSPTPLFAENWYRKEYPDVAAAITDSAILCAFEHYLNVGAAEGRSPCPQFDERRYLSENPDIRAAVSHGKIACGCFHFVTGAMKEGRIAAPHGGPRWHTEFIDRAREGFDGAWYEARFPEVAGLVEKGVFADAFEHFLRVGSRNGLRPSPDFDEQSYREEYEDVRQAAEAARCVSGFEHYLWDGMREGRDPSAHFDESVYRKRYPDVQKMIEEGIVQSGFDHYSRFGRAEGRLLPNFRISANGSANHTVSLLATYKLRQFLDTKAKLAFPSADAPLVSIIVVTFNRAELSLMCFESIALSVQLPYELVVIDNDSRDETSQLLDQIEGAQVLRNPTNKGFLLAVNQAVTRCRGELVLLLHNDAQILPGAVESAVQTLQSEPDAGAVGARIIMLNGSLQEAGGIIWSDGSVEHYGRGGDPFAPEHLFKRSVDFSSGAFLLTRKSTFERLGRFQTCYEPAYYEDVDYCARLGRHGLRVVYDPQAAILHHEYASSQNLETTRQLQRRNRMKFRELHPSVVDAAYERKAETMVPAHAKDTWRGHVLYIDNHPPLPQLGAGFPRANQLIKALTESGFFVTVFTTNPEGFDWREIYAQLSRTVEVITGRGKRQLAAFLGERPGFYDYILVSRPHNMETLAKTLKEGDLAAGARVIFDAEAVYGIRDLLKEHRLGANAPERRQEIEKTTDREIRLADAADAVLVVSASEQRLFRERVRTPVHLVSHAMEVTLTPRTFQDREGILFVGALHSVDSPNYEGLTWFIKDVLPLLSARTLEPVSLTVAGYVAAGVQLPEGSSSVRFLGRVDDLAELYDRSRVFVAPIRFAAGIPFKVHDSTAHGLPVVATALLAEQLGWQDGHELVVGDERNSARFADACLRLLTDERLWSSVRSAALRRVSAECSPERFRQTLMAALQ